MIRYAGEFFRAVFWRWITAIGLALDVVAVIVLAFADAGALTVSWPYLVIAALTLSLFASFLAYTEVLRILEPSLQFRATEQTLGSPTIRILSDAMVRVHAPVCGRFLNDGDDARVTGLKVRWISDRWVLPPKLIREVPLVKAGNRDSRDFSLRIGKADETPKLEFLFEGSWVLRYDEVQRLPRKSMLELDVTVVGQPGFTVPVANFENSDWEVPPKGESTKARRTEWQLAPEE